METEAKQIGQITNLLFDRCENCGYGLKHRDKKWCLRCIDVYGRRTVIPYAKNAEKIIEALVGFRYIEAKIEDLPEEIQTALPELKSRQDIYLYGEVGTGKTYAMAALIRQSIYEGYECERINFDSFCVKIRSTFAPAAKETTWELTQKLKDIDKLFIDDLGLRSEMESQFVYSTFYDLLNNRQERMLPTYISSNKTIEQLGQTFDARIASRLRTALVIEIKGEDRRTRSSCTRST